MRKRHTSLPLMILLTLVACVGAVVGWALSTDRPDTYPLQGTYEQHG